MQSNNTQTTDCFHWEKRYRVYPDICRFVFYGWTIAHFCSFTHLLRSVMEFYRLKGLRFTWTQSSNISPSANLSVSLSRDLYSIGSCHREITGRFHMLDPVGWPTPHRCATYCRRLSSWYSTFTFAFELLAPTRARCTETDSDGGSPAIAIDRSLRATSDHKKKRITPSRKWGKRNVTCSTKRQGAMWNFFSPEDRGNLSDRIRNTAVFFSSSRGSFRFVRTRFWFD